MAFNIPIGQLAGNDGNITYQPSTVLRIGQGSNITVAAGLFENAGRVGIGTSVFASASKLQVEGNVFVANGSAWFGNVTISNTTVSTNSTSGALVVAGGLGVADKIYVGGTLTAQSINNTAIGNLSPSTGQFSSVTIQNNLTVGSLTSNNAITINNLSSNGSIVTSGAVVANSITSNSSVYSPYLNASTSANVKSLTSNTSVIVNGLTDAVSTNTGALVVAGGVGIAGNAYIGGNITYGGVTLNYSVAGTGSMVLNNSPTFTGTITSYGNIQTSSSLSSGNLAVTNATASTSTVTGALVVAGGAGISGSIFAGGVIDAQSIDATAVGNVTPSTGQFTTVVVQNGLTAGAVASNGLISGSSLYSGATISAAGAITGSSITGNSSVTGGTISATSTLSTVDLNVTGVTSFTNVIATTSSTSGAVKISGGIATAANLYVAGATWQNNVSIFSTNAATNTTTGALVVLGGVGISSNLFVGGSINGANINVTGTNVPANGLYLPSANTLGFVSNSTEKMRITSTGGVSIGLTANQNMLDVLGGVAIGNYAGNVAAGSNTVIVSGQVGIGTSSTGLRGTNTNLVLGKPSTDSGNWLAMTREQTSNVGITASNGYMNFAADTISSGFAWTTNASGYALNGGYFAMFLRGGRLFVGGNPNNISVARSNIDVWGNQVIGSGYAGNVAAPTDGLAVYGQVGVGTTVLAAAAKLQIEGNLFVANSSAWLGNLAIANSSAATSTTSGALTVAGGVGISSNLFVGGSINGANVNVTSANAPPNGIFLPAANTLGVAVGSTERVRIDSSGFVGIGTTVPSTKLHLYMTGIAANQGLRIEQTASTQFSGAYLQLKTNVSTSNHQQVFLMNNIADASNTYGYFSIGQYNSGGSFVQTLADYQMNGDYWRFWTANTERIRIDSTGNVGIGSTTPTAKLDIRGNLRLGGSTSGYVGLAPAAAAGSTTYILPSADGTSNQVLSTNGSGTLSWASIATAYIVKTSNYTAVVGDSILADTSGGAFSITLPAAPTTGGIISILDSKGTFALNNLTINPNGKSIMGDSSNSIIATNNYAFDLVYNGTDWRIA